MNNKDNSSYSVNSISEDQTNTNPSNKYTNVGKSEVSSLNNKIEDIGLIDIMCGFFNVFCNRLTSNTNTSLQSILYVY